VATSAHSGISSEVSIGAVLGETYEVTRLLGEGGMGSVWEAKHLRLPGKRFAVKVLHGEVSTDAEAYARFRREAEIASRIGHPNIIEVLDWNTLPSGTPYLVLEFLDGEDLATRLTRGPLPLDQAMSIARQIGSALKAAHAADVVHRDLKPGNVFLVPREVDGNIVDHVKVLDFGISKIRNSNTVQTQDAVLLGTPQYMAPEQAQGKNNELDARTDLFALGAICYEMLAGRPPFAGDSLAQVVFKVVYEPPTPLAELAPEATSQIVAAIDRAMAKQPADRFPDMSSFIGALTGRELLTTDRRAVRGSGVGAVVPPTNPSAAARADTAPAPSHLRGEIQAKPPLPGSRKLVFLVAAVVVGAGGTFLGAKLLLPEKTPGRSDQPTPAATAPSATPTLPAAPTPPPIPTPPEGPTRVAPTAVVPTPAPTPTPTPHVVKKSTEPSPHADETISADARADLDKAEAALAANHPADAIFYAEKSIRAQRTSRAFAIETRAHCATGNLGSAVATYQNVAAADRPRVRKECKAHDVALR
jgi:serine/threonine-protein kinase